MKARQVHRFVWLYCCFGYNVSLNLAVVIVLDIGTRLACSTERWIKLIETLTLAHTARSIRTQPAFITYLSIIPMHTIQSSRTAYVTLLHHPSRFDFRQNESHPIHLQSFLALLNYHKSLSLSFRSCYHEWFKISFKLCLFYLVAHSIEPIVPTVHALLFHHVYVVEEGICGLKEVSLFCLNVPQSGLSNTFDLCWMI